MVILTIAVPVVSESKMRHAMRPRSHPGSPRADGDAARRMRRDARTRAHPFRVITHSDRASQYRGGG